MFMTISEGRSKRRSTVIVRFKSRPYTNGRIVSNKTNTADDAHELELCIVSTTNNFDAVCSLLNHNHNGTHQPCMSMNDPDRKGTINTNEKSDGKMS